MLYSTLFIGEDKFAIEIPEIIEITRSIRIHPIIGAPTVIDGLINLRGKIITIINSGIALGCNKVQTTEDSRIYILKTPSPETSHGNDIKYDSSGDDDLGIHVDSISEVMEIESRELHRVPANLHHPYFRYVIKDDTGFITVLHTEYLLGLSESKELS